MNSIKSDGWSTSYYELPEGVSEIQDLIEYKNMNFALGNIFKACYRMGQKDGSDALYDINKILWYAQREKDRLLKEKNLDIDVASSGEFLREDEQHTIISSNYIDVASSGEFLREDEQHTIISSNYKAELGDKK